MKKLIYFIVFYLLIFFLTGCATAPKTLIPTGYIKPDAISPRNVVLQYAPENIRVSYNEVDKSVHIFWNELADIKLYKGGYNIYRSLKEKELFMQINSEIVREITFTDRNIFEGETYYYCVTGILPNDNESPYSIPIKISLPQDKERLYDIETLSIDEITGNLLPVADAGGEIVSTINTPVIFNGVGRDRDGKIVKYEWDFDGNGTFDWSSSIDGKATYVYNEPKTYIATFRVLDNKLASGIDEIKVIVYRCPKNMVEVEGKFCIDKYEYPNDRGAFPIVNVNWRMAENLCNQQGKRLCTSEEWEKACSGPNNFKYPYGNEFSPHKCRSFMRWDKGPSPTGMHEECVSDYGVYDMSGNVWEWTDKPGAIYYGGFWDSGPEDSQCTSKFGLNPTIYYYDIGFRCCKD
ncbi:MAG: SUMF1/EgtB/PvdO family nonheme iron enzyme [Candidatus Firestonebacteria bacterium]|nr:SUMF1/EgtB/PvdO family nonheme iron enzyme [Candidatus Firestonebacteria bacterium]